MGVGAAYQVMWNGNSVLPHAACLDWETPMQPRHACGCDFAMLWFNDSLPPPFELTSHILLNLTSQFYELTCFHWLSPRETPTETALLSPSRKRKAYFSLDSFILSVDFPVGKHVAALLPVCSLRSWFVTGMKPAKQLGLSVPAQCRSPEGSLKGGAQLGKTDLSPAPRSHSLWCGWTLPVAIGSLPA